MALNRPYTSRVTLAEAQAERTKILAAITAKDPSVSRARLPDGTDISYDWEGLRARLVELDGIVAALSATTGVPTRRTYAKPQGNTW